MSEKQRPDRSGDKAKSVTHQNWSFVMNINRLIGATSYGIDPQHEVRRATIDEIGVIKDQVSKHAPPPQWYYSGFWEQQWPDPGGITNYLLEPDWRYYVVAGREGGNASDLVSAFDLAPVELEVGFSVIFLSPHHSGPAVNIDSSRLFHVLEHARTDDSFFVDISSDEIETIGKIYSLLRKHDDRLINVRRIVKQIRDLKKLPHYSPLRFLGYFAILESLLAHTPKPSDPYDSITRQVKKKLTLLDHRWIPKIDYTPFNEAKPETVWTKLYSYRSLIAHGGEPEFDGHLSILKDKETSLKIVKETAKAVIRQALLEPQLLLDLRDC